VNIGILIQFQKIRKSRRKRKRKGKEKGKKLGMSPKFD